MSKNKRKKEMAQLRRDVDMILDVLSKLVTHEMARRVRDVRETVVVPDEPDVEQPPT